MPAAVVTTGIVKFFNSEKGYGFIQPTHGGGKDVFVHVKDIRKAGLDTLREGQKLEFTIEHDANRGKLKATKIVAL